MFVVERCDLVALANYPSSQTHIPHVFANRVKANKNNYLWINMCFVLTVLHQLIFMRCLVQTCTHVIDVLMRETSLRPLLKSCAGMQRYIQMAVQ